MTLILGLDLYIMMTCIRTKHGVCRSKCTEKLGPFNNYVTLTGGLGGSPGVKFCDREWEGLVDAYGEISRRALSETMSIYSLRLSLTVIVDFKPWLRVK